MRFILVDHSITGLAGHHYEYAVHALQAAQRAGYEPVLVTNRKFRETGLPWTTLPLFEFGFWPEPRSSAHWRLGVQLVSWLAPRISLLHIRLRYSEIALAWQSRSCWSKYLRRQRGEGAPPSIRSAAATTVVFFRVLLLLCGAALLPVSLLAGIPAWILYASARFAARTARALMRGDKPVTHGIIRDFARGLISTARSLAHPGLAARTVFRTAASRLIDRKPARPQQSGAFGRDASRMIRALSPGSGDVVFFPTISEFDLAGLADELDRTRQGLEAGWHFLFRRNIYQGTRAEYAAQDAGLEELRLIFERVQRSPLAGRSYFYTDTHELTEQYDRLGIVRFNTLPVPHTYTVADRIPHHGPLHLTYLGDARTEKGFALLPEVAASLKGPYLAKGRAKLVLQCNYNIPGGEPQVAIARGELESMQGGYIDFYRKPLTSAEYRTLLLTADINLLCYDPSNYYARSSGILVESLAVGIPVIVPSGCWLSRQILGRQLDHINETREQMATLASKSMAELSWREDEALVGKVRPGELLRIEGKSRLRATFEVPHGATHVLVSGGFAMGIQSAVATITPIGWDDAPMAGELVFRMEAVQERKRASFLTELRAHVPKISIALRSSHPSQTAWMNALEIAFLRAPESRRFPKGAAGVIYDSPAQISALIADLIDHYPHYQRTAAEFSKSWREYHNSDRLIREMELVAGMARTAGEREVSRAERVAI